MVSPWKKSSWLTDGPAHNRPWHVTIWVSRYRYTARPPGAVCCIGGVCCVLHWLTCHIAVEHLLCCTWQLQDQAVMAVHLDAHRGAWAHNEKGNLWSQKATVHCSLECLSMMWYYMCVTAGMRVHRRAVHRVCCHV